MPHTPGDDEKNMGMGPSILDDYSAEMDESSMDDAELMALLGQGYDDAGEGTAVGGVSLGMPSEGQGGPQEPSNTPVDSDSIKQASFDLLKRSQERAERSKWFQSKAAGMQNRKL